MSIDALYDYLDGTDPALVANGARVLDQQAYENGQISLKALQETLNKTDLELFNERNDYRLRKL